MNTQVPADLNTVEDIAALEVELVAEFDTLLDADEQDLEAMTELAEIIEAVRMESATREEARFEQAERLAELANRVHPSAEMIEGVADDADDVDGSEEIVEEVTPLTEDNNTESEERVPVTAGGSIRPAGRKPSARAIRSTSGSPDVDARPTSPEIVITAAADIPGMSAGARITLNDVARAMHLRARSLPSRSARVNVATFTMPYDAEHTITDGTNPALVASMLDNIANPKRLMQGNSLVAAGGWCAPSEIIYDFVALESTDGLIDLPSIRINRGGVKIPDFLAFGAANDALFTWTEEDDIAALDNDGGEEDYLKATARIPCPEFTEFRLEAEGLQITHGNLTDIAYPELGARFLALALNGHLHRLSAAKIAKIVADAVAFNPTGIGSDVGGDVLSAVDLVVANLRSLFRLANSALVETVFPAWTAGLMRSNFAARAGVPMTNITDADVLAHLAARNIRAQFVHGYQNLVVGGVLATQWPTTLQFLAYPAGSYVEGNGGSIDLGVIRDSRLNETNDFSLAFTEQFYLVMRRGAQALKVNVDTNVFGVTGCCPLDAEAE